ncbi:substrate-binding domain-containing protein [Flavobacterium sp. MAH-1]|uniref:Substrate-binding domain-containing protein n=1 Tax=Flavobacterium agri TaxID=2743471 RepID=A0A7Y8Y553_9FLAO|nr:substrate-binding domain-containing protein [Flavobacterium agri]NUY82613.1 substrate-binding domain-containing protein [Flavobacterium agri]NYA72636.1 substrate-binding domain-containing protein [Flavobacterium agri]
MKKLIVIPVVVLGILVFAMCNKKSEAVPEGETILTGKASVLVDETLLPIMEDQVAVFESDYAGRINLMPRSEAEVIRGILEDSARIAVLARPLSAEERKYFNSKERFPRETQIGTDAIALIANKQNDTLIKLQDVLDVMQGKANPNLKGLVFDNLNSGTVSYLMKLAKIKDVPKTGVYSFNTNAEVVKFASENPGMVGVIGLNWLLQPTPEIESYLKNINILSVKSLTGSSFVYPSQNSLGEKTYPLARDLYIVNAQGYEGLGIGLASFVAGERGQRIILKSGLLPIRVPARKIVIRKGIEKKQ